MSILTREEIQTLLEETKVSAKDKNFSEALNKAINAAYDFTKLNSQELESVIEYLKELKESRKFVEELAEEILSEK